MKLSRLVAFVVAVTMLMTAAPAGAAKMTITDPEDVRGRLDLKEIRRSGESKLTWKLITHEKWTVPQVWSKGTLVVLLDTRNDEASDYYVTIYPTRKRMKALLFWDRQKKTDVRKGKVKAWRKTNGSVSIQLALSRLVIGDDRATFSWKAQSLFSSPHGCREICFDRAPQNDVWVTEPLPGP